MKKIIVKHKLILDLYNKGPEEMRERVIHEMLLKLAKEMYGTGMVELTESETKAMDAYDLDSKDFKLTAVVAKDEDIKELLKLIDHMSAFVSPAMKFFLNNMLRIIKS